jgi:hypothetical protein
MSIFFGPDCWGDAEQIRRSGRILDARAVVRGYAHQSPFKILAIPSGMAPLFALQPITIRGARMCMDLFSVSLEKSRLFRKRK